MKVSLIAFITLMIGTTQICSQTFPEKPIARFGKGYAEQVKFSPDGNYLAVRTTFQIELRSTRDWNPVAFIEGDWMDFSPDGKLLAYRKSYDELGRWDRRIRLWDVGTQSVKAILEESAGSNLQFSPDGKLLASNGGGRIDFWELPAARRLDSIVVNDGPFGPPLAFSPDGTLLATGKYNVGKIWLWDVASRQLLVTFEGHKRWVSALAFSPDGRLLASGGFGEDIRLWDIPNRQWIKTLGEGQVRFLNAIAFQPNGKLLASTESGVELWDVEAGQLVDKLEGPAIWPRSLSFHPDGKWLASSSYSVVAIWDVSKKSVLKKIDYQDLLRSLAFSPDGRFLAAGKSVWELSSGKVQFTLEPKFDVEGLDFNPEGSLLASSGGRIAFWSVPDGQLVGQMEGRPPGPLHFSPDGRWLVAGSSRDRILNLWDVKNPRLPRQVGDFPIFSGTTSLDISPDGKLLAAAAGNVQVWEMATQRLLHTLKEPVEGARTVVFSPDGKWFASESREHGIIHLWKLPGFELWKTLPGSYLTSPDFSPNGRYLAFQSGGVEIWEVATEKTVAILPVHNYERIRFSPDGRFLASLHRGFVLLWEMPPEVSEMTVDVLDKVMTTWGRVKTNQLLQNYPNPFNPETWMPFQLATDSPVTIQIHDVKGQLVRTLPLGFRKAGPYLSKEQAGYWDGRGEAGESVANGIYLYTLTAGDYAETKKMALLK